MTEQVVVGYMCKVAFDHELGRALGGELVYPSEADLISNHGCTDECGIVEVEVRVKRVIKECDFSIKPDKTYRVSKRDKNGKFKTETVSGKDLLAKKKDV